MGADLWGHSAPMGIGFEIRNSYEVPLRIVVEPEATACDLNLGDVVQVYVRSENPRVHVEPSMSRDGFK